MSCKPTINGIRYNSLDQLFKYNPNLETNAEESVMNTLFATLQKVNPDFNIELAADMGDLALVDFEQKLIQIGANADFKDVSEEMVHIFVEMLPEDLKFRLDNEVINTKIYGEVFKEYSNDEKYQKDGVPDIAKLKREAVGQMINSVLNGVPVQKIAPTGVVKKIVALLKEMFDFIRGNVDPLIEALNFINSGSLQGTVPDTGIYKSKAGFTSRGHLFSFTGGSILSKSAYGFDLADSEFPSVIIDTKTISGEQAQEFLGYLAVCIRLGDYSRLSRITIADLDYEAQFAEKMLRVLNNGVLGNGTPIKTALKQIGLDYTEEQYITAMASMKFTSESIKNIFNAEKIAYEADPTNIHLNKTRYVHSISNSNPLTDLSGVLARFTQNTRVTGLSKAISDLSTMFQSKTNPKDKTKLGNLLDALKTTVSLDEKRIETISGEGVFNLQTKSKFRSAIRSMEDSKDIIEGVDNLVNYLAQLTEITNSIKSYQLAPPSRVFGGGPLREGNKLAKLLVLREFVEPWMSIISEIRELNNNDNNELAQMLNVLSGNLADINSLAMKATKEEVANMINERLEEFNRSLESQYADKLKKLGELGLTEEIARIKEEIEASKYKLTETLGSGSYVEALLMGKMGDLLGTHNNAAGLPQNANLLQKGFNYVDKALGSVSNTITKSGDAWVVSMSHAHDPVLAILGEHMDKVVNEAITASENAARQRAKAEVLVKEAGGSVAVGKELTVIEDRLVRTKRLNADKNVYYYETQTQSTAVFVNQYGSRENYYIVINGVPITLTNDTNTVIGKVFTDHGAAAPDYSGRLRYQELTDALDTLKEYSTIIDKSTMAVSEEQLEAAIKDLTQIKEDFESEWFSSIYKEELQDTLSFRYITNLDERKEVKELTQKYYDILKERTRIQNILKYTPPDPAEDQLLRDSIVELNKQLQESRNEKTPEGKKLNDHLTRVESYRESNDNFDLLSNKILQIRESPGYSPFMKSKMSELAALISTDTQLLMKGIVKMHLETSDPSYHSRQEVSQSDVEELNTFLDDIIQYSESGDYYDDREEITQQLSEINMILDPGAYFMYVQGTPSQVMLPGFTSFTPEQNVILDSMLDMKGNPLLPVYTSLKEGKQAGGKFLFQFEFPHPDGPKTTYVLVEDGKPVGFNGIDESAAFTEIAAIAKKYRTSNLNQTTLRHEDQLRVTELSQVIENQRGKDQETFPGMLVKSLIARKIKLYEELGEISTTFYRENYYAEFRNTLHKFNGVSNPALKKLVNSTRFYSQFRVAVKEGLDDENLGIYNLMKDFDTNPDLNGQDRAVLQWILDNHVFSERKKGRSADTKVIYSILKPAKNHFKTIPSLSKFDRHYNVRLNGIYRESKYKDEYLNPDPKDTRGRLKPKKIQQSEATKKFASLTPELRKIHELMIDGVHIAEQSKTSPFVSKSSYLWYDVPTRYKHNSEIIENGSLREAWRKAVGSVQGKVNPLENELFGVDEIQKAERESKPGAASITKELYDSGLEYLRKVQNRSIDSIELLGKLDRDEDTGIEMIPVDFTQKMDGNNVSMDFMAGISDYTYSLNKAVRYSENVPVVKGVVDSIDATDKPGKKSGFERKQRIIKYLEQIVFKRNVGKNNFLSNAVRLAKKSIVLSSQTIGNPVGALKNVFQSLIVNYMYAPPNSKYGWKPQPMTTVKSAEWAAKVAKDRLNFDGKESLESFLVRRVNPNGVDISTLFSSDRHMKDFFASGDFIYSLQNGGERLVTYHLMLSTFNSMYFTTVPNDPETQVSFMDIWEETPNGWEMKTVYDNQGNVVTEEVLSDIKRKIDAIKFNTTGHGEKGAFTNTETGKTLLFFMNFIIPAILNGFTNNRRNFVENRVSENIHKAFIRGMIGMTVRPLMGDKAGKWELMTNGQKSDFIRGATLYLSMFIIAFIIKHLFGYDPDDDDKMAELDAMEHTWEGFFLTTAVKTLSELEGQALIGTTGNSLLPFTPFPIVGKNVGIIQKPFIITRMKNMADLAYNMLSGDEYTQNNRKLQIKAGDKKWRRQIQAFLPYNIFHEYNPDTNPIQALRNLEGAKNMQ